MKTPQHYVPTLPEIRALETVSRLGSVSAAAVELNVSQPTVSYHIKQLESRWHIKLFHKKGRKLKPTEISHDIYAQISTITSSIDNLAFYLSQASQQKNLSIGVATSFASIVLISVLDDFCEQYPQVNIKLNASNRYTDFASEGIDVTLRLLPHLEVGSAITKSNPLIPVPNEQMQVVCSPDYLAKHLVNANNTSPLSPVLLQNMQLIHEQDTSYWQKYITAYAPGLTGPLAQQLCFNNADLILKSAISGKGVAIIRDLYVNQAIRDGLLIAPFESSLPCERIFQFVLPDKKMPTTQVWDYISWLGSVMHDIASPNTALNNIAK
ncbi:MAG: LysR family glycine cleavage system transcriptional activator [Oceanospirillaceae bacterium]|jgi:LysR family glycine cleavage system transcriptional activator